MNHEPASASTLAGRVVAAAVPGRSRVLAAGLSMLAAGMVVERMTTAPLPFDETFQSVLYLMWSADVDQTWIPVGIAVAVQVMAFVTPLFLISWAIVWPRDVSLKGRALLRSAYRLAPFWPLFVLVYQTIGRATANAVYALAPLATGDMTAALARLEGPLLEKMQQHLARPGLDALFADLYSWVWAVGLFGVGPWLVVSGRERAAARLLVGTILMSVLAIPFFLLLPVFEPWATNPAYGYAGAGQTAVRYLYPDPDLARLSMIAVHSRWATGACLPSLHVAFPLLFCLIAMKHRLRAESWLLAALTASTSVAVVYLGRHWIVDVVAAVPFALAVHWLVERLDPELAFPWRPGTVRAD